MVPRRGGRGGNGKAAAATQQWNKIRSDLFCAAPSLDQTSRAEFLVFFQKKFSWKKLQVLLSYKYRKHLQNVYKLL
jgi:hypothetical protein